MTEGCQKGDAGGGAQLRLELFRDHSTVPASPLEWNVRRRAPAAPDSKWHANSVARRRHRSRHRHPALDQGLSSSQLLSSFPPPTCSAQRTRSTGTPEVSSSARAFILPNARAYFFFFMRAFACSFCFKAFICFSYLVSTSRVESLNFEGSYLGQFPLVSAQFWTRDHLSSRSRKVDGVSDTFDR